MEGRDFGGFEWGRKVIWCESDWSAMAEGGERRGSRHLWARFYKYMFVFFGGNGDNS